VVGGGVSIPHEGQQFVDVSLGNVVAFVLPPEPATPCKPVRMRRGKGFHVLVLRSCFTLALRATNIVLLHLFERAFQGVEGILGLVVVGDSTGTLRRARPGPSGERITPSFPERVNISLKTLWRPRPGVPHYLHYDPLVV